MREHLLRIDDFYLGTPGGGTSILNISIYKKELVSICCSPSLSVNSIKDAYKNHRISGVLEFEGQKPISLSKGAKLTCFHSISRQDHLVPSLSVTDNLFALQKRGGRGWIYDPKHAKIAAADLMEELELPIDPGASVTELTLMEHHMLLLAKAFISSGKLILLDNIVEYYTAAQLRSFLRFIKRLQAQGFTFLVFTNGPSPLTQESDRIFVIRNHEITNILYHTEYSDKQLESMMLGGDPHLSAAKKSYRREDVILSLDWSSMGLPPIDLCRQECLCVFHANGSNIGELYDSLTSRFPYTLDGKRCTSYSSAIKNGLAPVAVSRLEDYFFPHLALSENLTLPILHKISAAGVINRKLLNYCTDSSLQKMRGRLGADEIEDLIKALLLRWRLMNPKLMLLSDFSVSNAGRPELYRLLNDINRSGCALIILSSNLYDCLYFADSLLVIGGPSDYRLFHKAGRPSFVKDVKAYLRYSPESQPCSPAIFPSSS